jgi:hypothetical protein
MSPFAKFRTISPFFNVIVEHGPLEAYSSSLSLNILSRKLGGASSKTGSGGFSSTTSA